MQYWQYSSTATWNDWDFMYHNSEAIYDRLGGWSLNAVCAVLGNMAKESGVNPWSDGTGGYGLCGWTPKDTYISWCEARGLDYTLGDTQIELLLSGEAPGGGSHWGGSADPHAPQVSPPLTWNEFKTSTLDIATLTSYFMYYYEKPSYDPSVSQLTYRQSCAALFYEHLSGYTPITTIPPWLLFQFDKWFRLRRPK